MPQIVSEPLDPQQIRDSARWLAQAYDAASGLVRFVAMDPHDYRHAAFLDDRLFQQWRDVQVLPWPVVDSVMAERSGSDCRWIFHIGHVGSTLVARMLGELDGVLSVREPRILRDLVQLAPDEQQRKAPIIGALCSRTFTPAESALVKATSFVSEIAPLLAAPAGPVVFIYVGAASYIETILAGENSVTELRVLEEYRSQRMEHRVPPMRDCSRNDAHRAAAAWACEMTALEAAAEALPEQSVRWIDFDRFLADPGNGLKSMAEHFGFVADSEASDRIAAGPLMRRYSKDSSFDYSPELRRELQSEVRLAHAGDIDSALAMLDEAGQSSTLLKRAIDRSARRD